MSFFLFNEAISALGLFELPFFGKQFTWTNKQFLPLLECLDRFFTSNSWTPNYPNTTVRSLVMETSDYSPCMVDIQTSILRGHIFRFENYWMEHEHFMQVVQHGW